MAVVLLRVGIDSGTGGIQGPLFDDGTFEYVPIPDRHRLEERTYGTTVGRAGRALADYFPPRMRSEVATMSMHFDPEFETFTYGDPGPPKRSLRRLGEGDLLVFYAGLQPWTPGVGSTGNAHLYLIGYFEVQVAGLASEFSPDHVYGLFGANAHVRLPDVFAEQHDRLVLVKGGAGSKLLTRAVQFSDIGRDVAGRPLKVISDQMQAEFGSFGGRHSFQRSPPRWVDDRYVESAAAFVRSLP